MGPSRCNYCGLVHTDVNNTGVKYCPNPLCPGPGGEWSRVILDSYIVGDDNQTTTFDHREHLANGLKKLTLVEDKDIVLSGLKAAQQLLDKWRVEKFMEIQSNE